ncbi:hypothetical protein COOONC_16669 [Cooperia oncophora]
MCFADMRTDEVTSDYFGEISSGNYDFWHDGRALLDTGSQATVVPLMLLKKAIDSRDKPRQLCRADTSPKVKVRDASGKCIRRKQLEHWNIGPIYTREKADTHPNRLDSRSESEDDEENVKNLHSSEGDKAFVGNLRKYPSEMALFNTHPLLIDRNLPVEERGVCKAQNVEQSKDMLDIDKPWEWSS